MHIIWLQRSRHPSKRQNGDNQPCYQFIGEPFIYGNMDGRAISVLSEGQSEDKTIEFKLV